MKLMITEKRSRSMLNGNPTDRIRDQKKYCALKEKRSKGEQMAREVLFTKQLLLTQRSKAMYERLKKQVKRSRQYYVPIILKYKMVTQKWHRDAISLQKPPAVCQGNPSSARSSSEDLTILEYVLIDNSL